MLFSFSLLGRQVLELLVAHAETLSKQKQEIRHTRARKPSPLIMEQNENKDEENISIESSNESMDSEYDPKEEITNIRTTRQTKKNETNKTSKSSPKVKQIYVYNCKINYQSRNLIHLLCCFCFFDSVLVFLKMKNPMKKKMKNV
jgi:hypothetical protein